MSQEIPKFGDVAAFRFNSHSTEAEIMFIRHLGKWALRHKLGRLQLLQLYLLALQKRECWDGITQTEVMVFLLSSIKEERTRES